MIPATVLYKHENLDMKHPLCAFSDNQTGPGCIRVHGTKGRSCTAKR